MELLWLEVVVQEALSMMPPILFLLGNIQSLLELVGLALQVLGLVTTEITLYLMIRLLLEVDTEEVMAVVGQWLELPGDLGVEVTMMGRDTMELLGREMLEEVKLPSKEDLEVAVRERQEKQSQKEQEEMAEWEFRTRSLVQQFIMLVGVEGQMITNLVEKVETVVVDMGALAEMVGMELRILVAAEAVVGRTKGTMRGVVDRELSLSVTSQRTLGRISLMVLRIQTIRRPQMVQIQSSSGSRLETTHSQL